MQEKLSFYVITDRRSTNPAMSNDGGDYDFGRTVAVDESGVPVAVRFWTSSDFSYCPHSGRFGRCEERWCEDEIPFDQSLVEGWEKGELLAGDEAEIAARRYENGLFQKFTIDSIVDEMGRKEFQEAAKHGDLRDVMEKKERIA